jgi:hypothetical protein
VEPPTDPGLPVAEVRLALRDLVRVVDLPVVLDAGVDVEVSAQPGHADGGAEEVPAGVAVPPRGVPAGQPVTGGPAGPPEGEVGLVAPAGDLLGPGALPLPVGVDAGELPVVGDPGGVEVETRVEPVGVAALLQPSGEGHHLVDVRRAARVAVGGEHVDRTQVGQEGLGVEVGDLPDVRFGPAEGGPDRGGGLRWDPDPVHVGDHDDVPGGVPLPVQRAAQHVHADVRPQRAQVRVGEDQRPAAVDADHRATGRERPHRPPARVEQRQRLTLLHVLSPGPAGVPGGMIAVDPRLSQVDDSSYPPSSRGVFAVRGGSGGMAGDGGHRPVRPVETPMWWARARAGCATAGRAAGNRPSNSRGETVEHR